MKKESTLPFFEGVGSIERWLETDDKVRLKIFHFTPLKNTGKCPVVLLTGLATAIDSNRIYQRIYVELSMVRR